jgi:hypothetical protein
MSTLRLSMALSGYVHTNELTNGRIRPDGIDLTIITRVYSTMVTRIVRKPTSPELLDNLPIFIGCGRNYANRSVKP